LQEAVTTAENKAKDFEYMLAELEYRVNQEKACSKEDMLRQEIKHLREEIDLLGSHHDQIKSETSDMVSELTALKLQLDESNKKVAGQDFLLKQALIEKEKFQAKIASVEKEIQTQNEKIKEQDRKIIELTKKNVEVGAAHMLELDKKDQEFLQVLKKAHMDNEILKNEIERLKEETDAINIRTRNETCLLPNFDQSVRQAAQTINFEMPGTFMLPQGNLVGSDFLQASESSGANEEPTIDKDKELELPDDFRRDSLGAQMTSSGIVRRETGDSKMNTSMNQSRRGSTFSNRLALRQLAFGSAKNTDEKLQAEINELKIKIKEAYQESATKVNGLLVILHNPGRT
jgi:hypothetical protein